MPITDKELFNNGNSYRLHQDKLRWTLLAAYAAFLVGIMGLSNNIDRLFGIAIVIIGICYMFILAVENFFYNLFAEYVKDCESRHTAHKELRTFSRFANDEAKRIGPFHHSFFFALIIVLLGNVGLNSHLISDPNWNLYLNLANLAAFFLIFFFWRILVYPYFISPLQRIFDVALEERNIVWRFFSRFADRKHSNKRKS